jgi:hypothetical protein
MNHLRCRRDSEKAMWRNEAVPLEERVIAPMRTRPGAPANERSNGDRCA